MISIILKNGRYGLIWRYFLYRPLHLPMPIDLFREEKKQLLVGVEKYKISHTFDSFFASVYAK